MIQGIKLYRIVRYPDTRHEVMDGRAFAVGNGDAMFHSGGHLLLPVHDGRKRRRAILYFVSCHEDFEQFIDNLFLISAFQVEANGFLG
jgi:hypothetical protein